MKQMLPVMDLTSGIGGIAIDEDPAPRRGREKVKRDLIQNLRTTVFGNSKISERPGSLDFTLGRNVPEFNNYRRENLFF